MDRGLNRWPSRPNSAFVPVDKFELQPTEASSLSGELSMSRYYNLWSWPAPPFVLVLAWTVVSAWAAPAGEPADAAAKAVPLHAHQPEPDGTKVIRDEVRGSILHGGGKTTWRRIIGQAKVLDASTLEFADGTRIELDLAVP